MLKNAKWIWSNDDPSVNEYAEFYRAFTWNGQPTLCRISVDGDYTLFVNGKFVASNQYGDYEYYKIYDTIELTPYLKAGENDFAVLVWHFGEPSQRYVKAAAGLLYEIEEGGQVRVQSDETTLSRKSRAYTSGDSVQKLSPQLGRSFAYDKTAEDDWTVGGGKGFSPSVLVKKTATLFPRPIEKLELKARKDGKVIDCTKTHYTLDLGEETVGLFSIKFKSDRPQKILVSFGEDLQNGHVRRIIGNRDFSFTYVAEAGENEYVNYTLRLGCRYLEVDTEAPIELVYAGVFPQVYPTKRAPFALADPIDQKIYDVSVKTLELCMMEHYVDCPWREQCLYSLDSRNQIVCGYYAFENGNAAYARANLLLMSKDKRADGLMSICYPCGDDLTIPSFSLYYLLSVKEYLTHTGDLTLAEEVYPKMTELLDTFTGWRKEGLVCKFEGKNHWNFYDWSLYSEGALLGEEEAIPDGAINCLYVFAVNCFGEIAKRLGKENPYAKVAKEVAKKTVERFYDEEKGAFTMTAGKDEYTEIVNALAVLSGVATGEKAEKIAALLASGSLVPCALSMRALKYDAMLMVGQEKYREYILDEIRRDYKFMLDAGATSFWETLDGAAAFENAGSLCHGWSAIPVYYYHKLK